ncbi:hypothetical protein COY51_02765 [Candidatus Desantisbacteria bacterium CG_4_10_14_0_8_um_filter_39_17]|uniref:Hemolysin n=3 Tax=unclassified Candidatus Desantisiibacteriota TaxID=3106372 RepID=A0A2H9PD08_9BACT|nr:MAG: hypothetical protein COY51_02765 [Candidatus Desantisbacteria bacterium CG_4_10_14_0_8_um_filter_39_17]
MSGQYWVFWLQFPYSSYSVKNMFIKFIILFFLLLLSAFFNMAEITLTSLDKWKLEKLIKKREEEWADEVSRLLTTVLVGTDIANLSASAIASTIALDIFGNKGIAIATGIMIFVILFFCEITPKIFSKQHAKTMSPFIIKVLMLFDKLFYPVTRLFVLFANFLIFLFRGESVKSVPFITEEELRSLVDIGEKEGVLEKDEREMIHSVFEFGDVKVSQIMKPLETIVAVKEEMQLNEILNIAVESGYSRIPVYREDLNHITGIIYTKDILNLWKNKTLIKLQDIIREPYFVMESMKVKDLLKQFQSRKLHIGLVIDENNITKGLVTLEDVVEEIVGEIHDEYDIE